MNKNIEMPKNVTLIIDRLLENGYEAYMVGGCVRDCILGKEPKDWDITTNAKPLEVVELFDKVILTGLKHGTVTVMLNKESYEITTYRSDGEYEDNRHPKEVKFVSSLKEDLARRDFTINSMAYNDISGLVDYFNGVEDLGKKIIRTVGDPRKRFDEDALRMLRAIRFSAQLDFTIDRLTLNSIKELKDNIRNISKERVREEFNKILLNNPRKIEILRECGILEYIVPGISKIYNFNKNNSCHSHDLYNHTIISTETVESQIYLRLSMLFHDFGKACTIRTHENDNLHYSSYSKESSRIANEILKYLKYDNNIINKVTLLIQYHDYRIDNKVSIKKLLREIGIDLFKDLIKIQRADILTQDSKYSEKHLINLDEAENILNEIIDNDECFNLKNLKINGGDLLSLGFNKGKEIGEMLNYLLDIVIENPKLNEKRELVKLVMKRWR
ncbi:CCA tRNA nucleotidyltransferase [Clostridium beijerinckii]|uniref:CCA tRNA nucleotidyltransferase n=1 Tax=Clostridium beijerinckii TaxID=1520 RepID=A0A1S9N147_CLOBE|nr:CCA tRNA nucleotidyltransferase [Clostridium beijerinckii]MZK49744.1 CCA tRNA nucleotidyltransferase [Clostridium beijerinckii]MZK57704.1 CCA tRNA nucleotidyltransferase [Clostridium beijerinckii]MZK67889.1 CCA tRNA nucleotidyltransferase [Clostridium beijerinckii]MZK73412.1 CCA tRNA nucleotidyltransferase [Clostridium beijerinckii]MZK82995.1 CCA tRNA nucleotidyltransferase [Clostridium beijerinckii]